jgi:hypothetical protein
LIRSKYEKIFSGSSFDTDEEIKNGAIGIIYASPETLVGDYLLTYTAKRIHALVHTIQQQKIVNLTK